MSDVLERGNVYFVYRPKLDADSPKGLDDVQRFYMILSPHGKKRYRKLLLGQKKLPEIENGGSRYWAFVETVGRNAKDVEDELDPYDYQTKTRGERHVPPARPAGEGVYVIARHDDHTHFAYALELPEKPGSVQRELNIDREASYVVSVANPERPSPRGAGLRGRSQAKYPKKLKDVFRGRKFADVDPPEFLDHEGAELILIGADEDPSEELGIRLDPQKENERTAEIFNDLRMERSEHPTKPLFDGEWE